MSLNFLLVKIVKRYKAKIVYSMIVKVHNSLYIVFASLSSVRFNKNVSLINE